MVLEFPPSKLLASSGVAWSSDVQILRGGRVLTEGIPVLAGRVVEQSGQAVPDQLDGLRLPSRWEGVVLDPALPGSVLDVLSSRVRVWTTITAPIGGRSWRVPMGTFVVSRIRRARGSVTVTGVGLLDLVRRHQRAIPGGTSSASQIAAEVMRILAEDGLTAVISPALPARTLPAGFSWGRDRLKALVDLVEAWPAQLAPTPFGEVELLPPPQVRAEEVVVLRDGEGGTLVEAPSEYSRDQVINHSIVPVKATTEDGSSAPEQYAQYSITSGPLSVQDVGWLSEVFESDAITSLPQAQAVAVARVSRAGRAAVTLDVDAVPDWSIACGRTARVERDGGLQVDTGIIIGRDMPLTWNGGPARYQVGVSL